jgi:hypothetical protein
MIIRAIIVIAGLNAELFGILSRAKAETCIASPYGVGNGYHGRRTASGERFNTDALNLCAYSCAPHAKIRQPRHGHQSPHRPQRVRAYH